ncbi:hypothetical protein [Thermogymnomonas acidicola]|uniref:TIM-barrel domain-containing protein n=1 Tax=Thermogymnomonas acidicola TaxID=399579 RepID=UPI001396C11E|nr:TIM-barrel domain-containing protein [Thermogymnomonas acidicola]
MHLGSGEFPDPEALLDFCSKRGIYIVPIIDPGVRADQGYDVFKKFIGNAIEDSEGNLYFDRVWPGTCIFPDFLRSSARQIWGDLIKSFYRPGMGGIWLDMSEPSMHRTRDAGGFGNNIDPAAVHTLDNGIKVRNSQVHNLYAYYEAMTTYEALKGVMDKPFILTRAGYPGIQKTCGHMDRR